MVRILSVYRFQGQMVDTVEDMSSLTITNHDKLLVAQSDYSIEVKDLLSEKRTPIFVFPTIDQVQDLIHCAAGNYVATIEGKQTFQKSDVLIVRIYTNWEPDSTDYTISNKRYVRPRIAGMVTPSNSLGDTDYLDMIEIPINFMSPTTISCCQKTGRLLIACGPTIHLFNQTFKRGNNISPEFMDFIAVTEVFDLVFQPYSVIICEDIIAAYCSDTVSVFRLKNVNENILMEKKNEKENSKSVVSTSKKNNDVSRALNINHILELVDENREDELSNILNKSSFPVKICLEGINDGKVTTTERKFPFSATNKSLCRSFQNGKLKDHFIVTLSEEKPTVVAENLLALKMNESEELISKIALQIIPVANSSEKVHFFFSTFQEGYLFYGSKDIAEQGDLHCVAVFSFTAQVMDVLLEPCVFHVLTEAGLETYNLPTLRSIILNESINVTDSYQNISIFDMRPFFGVLNFIRSNNLITVFSSASDTKKGKESLPWTMYSLKIPTIYNVYQEMIDLCREFHSDDEYSYKYLSLESFLILQMALNLKLPLDAPDGKDSINEVLTSNAIELAELLFKSGNTNEIKTSLAVILACGKHPLEFVKGLHYADEDMIQNRTVLLKEWLKTDAVFLKEQDLEYLIKILGGNGDLRDLAEFLLANEQICRSISHKLVQLLKTYVSSQSEQLDAKVLFVLCILSTQTCQQADVVDTLKSLSNDEEHRAVFEHVILEHWNFLFDRFPTASKDAVNFSELTSLLVEYTPLELSRVLSKLIIDQKFVMTDIVQLLLKLFPCHVSVQRGHLVLRMLLETIFSCKTTFDFKEPSVCNCTQILMRSYLTELFTKDAGKSALYQPLFVDKLPEYVNYLPLPENVSIITLRRLQEMIWNRMVDEKIVKEVADGLSNLELKLNLLAMLNNFDFIEVLLKNNLNNVILPFAKSTFRGLKHWQDLLYMIQNRMSELKNRADNFSVYENIFCSILEHLAHTMSPTQVSGIMLESSISRDDAIYQKYVMMAQKIVYANDVKGLIINTSQQLLQSNSLY